MERPLVSVRIVTWNHEKYIGAAIESVLRQKVNFKYEILIADDKSSDNTAKVLDEYQKKYPELITVYHREVNLGMNGNTDKLTCKCRGKYIAVLEGDDYWCDDLKLQKQIDFLESHKKVTATAHNVLCVDANGKPLQGELIDFPYQKEHLYTKEDAMNCIPFGQLSSLVFRNFCDIMTRKQWKMYKRCSASDEIRMSVTLGMLGCIYYFEDTWSCRRRISTGTSYILIRDKNHTRNVCATYLKLQQYMKVVYGVKTDVTGYITYMFKKSMAAVLEEGLSIQGIKNIQACLISYMIVLVRKIKYKI